MKQPRQPLRVDPSRLESVEGWGRSTRAPGYVYRPSTVDGICDVYTSARLSGKSIGIRGAGCSYGDAAINAEGIVLELSRMNRVLQWDPEEGIVTIEPGVTVRQLWQYVIEDGWWPPVVPGTMFVTLGGALAMNIHGKNNWKIGPIGDHVVEFTIMTAGAELRICSRESNSELFHAAIGGFGMFGAIISITLKLKRVYSGLLDVEALSVKNFDHLLEVFESRLDTADYLVGWVDCFGTGNALGRGLVHGANYLENGEDLEPHQSLRVVNQELPDTVFGLIPKSTVWRVMKLLNNDPGMRTVNAVKYVSSSKLGDGARHQQSHAGFAFLLDYVPDWKKAYGNYGLIQYQSFVPAESAGIVFSEQIRTCQKYGIVPYLGVFKRHRKDNFLMSHAVNGYSFALDFSLSHGDRGKLLTLTCEMDRLVLEAGGRFYPAKDSTLSDTSYQRSLGPATIDKFRRIKEDCDPHSMLETNLYRRLLGGNST